MFSAHLYQHPDRLILHAWIKNYNRICVRRPDLNRMRLAGRIVPSIVMPKTRLPFFILCSFHLFPTLLCYVVFENVINSSFCLPFCMHETYSDSCLFSFYCSIRGFTPDRCKSLFLYFPVFGISAGIPDVASCLPQAASTTR